MSDYADDLGDLDSPLPWNIGQDGTGAYPFNYDGDIDEMAIWRRPLTLDELRQVYAGAISPCGVRLLRNAEVTQLSPMSPPRGSILPLRSGDPAGGRNGQIPRQRRQGTIWTSASADNHAHGRGRSVTAKHAHCMPSSGPVGTPGGIVMSIPVAATASTASGEADE